MILLIDFCLFLAIFNSVAQRVTANWLLGISRYPALLQRFPFMQALANGYRVVGSNCGGCGGKGATRQFTTNINDTLRILATIPESEIQEFKRLSRTDSLHIVYSDIRGNKQSIVR